MLDGLRGVAILLVLYHHFVFYSGLRAETWLDAVVRTTALSSWLGVDLFFVLSGFLITGILIDSRGGSRYFRSFYMRRVLRIFPLYYGCLALWFFVEPLLTAASQSSSTFMQDSLWYWTYLVNVDLALHGWPQPVHLAHFWSLAVEEQFYLVWPLVVLLVAPRRLGQVTIACIAFAPLFRIALAERPLAAYVLTPARIDALALGALLACWVREPGGLLRRARWTRLTLLVALIGLGMIVAAKGTLDSLDPIVRTGGFSLIAALFAGLLAEAVIAPTGSALARFLSAGWLAFFGRYSYALYVFHHPVCVFLRDAGLGVDTIGPLWGSELPGVVIFTVVGGSISLVLALLSWHLWEAPFLRLKRFFPR